MNVKKYLQSSSKFLLIGLDAMAWMNEGHGAILSDEQREKLEDEQICIPMTIGDDCELIFVFSQDVPEDLLGCVFTSDRGVEAIEFNMDDETFYSGAGLYWPLLEVL